MDKRLWNVKIVQSTKTTWIALTKDMIKICRTPQIAKMVPTNQKNDSSMGFTNGDTEEEA